MNAAGDADDARAPLRDGLLLVLGTLYLVLHAAVSAFLDGGTFFGLGA